MTNNAHPWGDLKSTYFTSDVRFHTRQAREKYKININIKAKKKKLTKYFKFTFETFNRM